MFRLFKVLQQWKERCTRPAMFCTETVHARSPRHQNGPILTATSAVQLLRCAVTKQQWMTTWSETHFSQGTFANEIEWWRSKRPPRTGYNCTFRSGLLRAEHKYNPETAAFGLLSIKPSPLWHVQGVAILHHTLHKSTDSELLIAPQCDFDASANGVNAFQAMIKSFTP